MPHNAVKIIPGVDTTRTPALNEAALSSTNLIRLVPDRQGLGLVQKLGGWTSYYQFPFNSPIRHLKGWADLNSTNHLAVGTQNSLNVLTSNSLKDVTPLYYETSIPAVFATTSGSATVTVTDSEIVASVLDFVEYITPVSIGGIVLQGPYSLRSAASNTYSILNGIAASSTQASNTPVNAGSFVVGKTYSISFVGTTDFTLIGSPNNTLGTVFVASGVGTGTGTAKPVVVPVFKTTSGSSEVEVFFANHNFSVGQIFTISPTVAVTVGGVTLSGAYTVYSVSSVNKFTIISTTLPSSTSNFVAMNGNEVASYFYIAVGPQPANTGYGVGGYGVGGYGTGSTQTPTQANNLVNTSDWSLDNFGQILIANPAGGAIYYYDPTGPVQTSQILGEQCPLFNDGVFVAMPQRQLVAYGSSFGLDQDPMLIRWSDIEDPTVWIGTSTNQAGSYRIPAGSAIVAGMQAYQQGLFWTDLDMWSMQYIGPPLVYGFNKIASNCGAISRKCVGQLNNTVYWMSQKQFFRSSGSGAEPLPCPVWDVIFQNLNRSQLNKIRCGVNSQYNEIVWYYPSGSNVENDSYVKYNVVLNQWDFGQLGRSAWIDQSVLGSPIGAGTDNFLYQHETSNAAASGTQSVPLVATMQTGYFALSEADKMIFIDQIWPDMKWGDYGGSQNAKVNISFLVTNYPGDAPIVYGPYEMTQAVDYISVRIRARLMSIQISSPTDPNTANQFWRLGNIRYRFQEDGRF